MDVIHGFKDLFCFWRLSRPTVPFSVLFKKFKAILERNNRILELMADMGDKLGGEYIFDHRYIVDVCEQVNDLIFKLISDYCILSRSDNVDLFVAFERIRHEIQEELAGRRALPMTRPAVLLEALSSDLSEEAGNKFSALGDVRNILGLSMPDGFVITTKAFFDFMEYNSIFAFIESALDRWDGRSESSFESMCTEVRKHILGASIPRPMASHVNAMLDIFSSRHSRRSLHFAVRSSAWGEDGEISFAGQYESVLNVPANGIFDAYRQVVASAYTPQAWQYRLHRGYKEHETAMAVGCQLMVQAVVSGAMYTYAPLPQEREAMVVSGTWGLGPAVVQGIAESDTFFLDRSPPHRTLSEEIALKARMMVPSPERGTEWVDVPESMREVPSLSARQLQELARAAAVIERYYKRPQDIEWAFNEQGSLLILQTRPLNIRPVHPRARLDLDAATRSASVVFSDKGIVVQGGVGSGQVYIAHGDDDLRDFPHGAILVAQYTSPKYVRVMRKAHGIITDVGSATGHMATLAREYRVPTIVDTGVATKTLIDGEEITLDAMQNRVYRGRVRELSHFELTEQEVFEESYEYRLLRRLLKKISPLHLVDPHSEDFKAGKCRTYHDITRFIHERAVEKLIELSRKYRKVHDKMPKRLETELPLGLMIIDIEDGTNAPPNAKSVTSAQIRSAPLKALIEGISVPGMWTTDPAPIDLVGFMSSVTRTFSSPLAIPGKSGQNLAVVSKEYMNLNLKLGYHFNLVDAYIGKVPNDNYLCFRFLGGVTDLLRRSRRAKFIAEVLERLDFRVELHGDLVVGRVKKISRDRICSKMRVLGGLIGYARQLDVSMNSDEQVARYSNDFMEHVQQLTRGGT